MALSDLAVFSEYAYAAKTEVLRQQVELFNGATAGALIMRAASHQGDFSDVAFFQKITGGTVRRRNAYGTGAVTEKVLKHLVDTSVKVASGTPPIRMDPGQFNWIKQDPKSAGAALGQQLAVDSMADMLNVALGVVYAATNQVAALVNDISGNVAPADKISWAGLNDTQAKFGDRSGDIAVWIMHSKPMHDLYGNNLANANALFTFGSVNVIRDAFGKLLVMTDSPNLVNAGVYRNLGLVPGAVYIGENDDFDAMEEGKTGDENLIRVYQAEWSNQLGVKGFSWDKTNGGKSPNDAALLTATNWDKYATDNKDLPGVIMKTK